jgi:MFS family permease
LLGWHSHASARPVVADGLARSHAREDGGFGRTFSALRYRNFRLFWCGQLISVTGTFMQSTAQQWLVLTLSSNALDLGIVGALQFGPLLVLAPFGGAIADRWPRRQVLVVTQAASGALALALYVLTVVGVVRIWQVFLLALLLGLVNAVDMPARQAFVSEMVPTDRLLNAVSLNSAQFNASRIVGPAIAGAVIALLGMPILFLLNAVSYVAVIAGLVMMRPAELMPVPRIAASGHGLARLRAMNEGMRFVLRAPLLRVSFFLLTVVAIFGFNFNVLVPLAATQGLHAGPAVFGLLTSALGVGALCGALLLAQRGGTPTNQLLSGMVLAFGALETGLAFAHSVALVMVLFAASGFCMSSFSAAATTRVQLASPVELRGRVMSVYSMVFIGTTPIGNLLISGIAGGAGIGVAFVVAGVPCFLAGAMAAWWWRTAERSRVSAPAATAPATSLALPELASVPAIGAQMLSDLATNQVTAAEAGGQRR